MNWPWKKKEKNVVIYDNNLEDLRRCLNHLKAFMDRQITIRDLQDDVVTIFGGKRFLLPSGRIGNILALSLELRSWFVSRLLIECEGVDIEMISCLPDGSSPISAKEYITNLKEYYDIYGDAGPYNNMLEKIAMREKNGCTKIVQK